MYVYVFVSVFVFPLSGLSDGLCLSGQVGHVPARGGQPAADRVNRRGAACLRSALRLPQAGAQSAEPAEGPGELREREGRGGEGIERENGRKIEIKDKMRGECERG